MQHCFLVKHSFLSHHKYINPYFHNALKKKTFNTNKNYVTRIINHYHPRYSIQSQLSLEAPRHVFVLQWQSVSVLAPTFEAKTFANRARYTPCTRMSWKLLPLTRRRRRLLPRLKLKLRPVRVRGVTSWSVYIPIRDSN